MESTLNMFIIDFDDTLFDTHAFKEARLQAMLSLGIDEKLFWETYYEARNNNDGIFTYSDALHAQILAKYGYNEEEIIKFLHEITARAKYFLLPGAVEFLSFLKSLNRPMILLSLGDPNYQELKVKQTEVDKFFDRLFMIDKTKGDILSEIFSLEKEEDSILINDKVEESLELTQDFPGMKVVLRQSPGVEEEKYINSKLPYFKNLSDIKKYISNYVK